MLTASTKDDGRSWPPGKGAAFDRLVVFSAWLLLASYDDDFDAAAGNEDPQRKRTRNWRCWRHLEHLDDKELSTAIADELLPQLERDFIEPGHPLRLLRSAFDNKPLDVLRDGRDLAFQVWIERGSIDRDAARAEWETQAVECSLSQHPAVLPSSLQGFLAEAVMPQWGERFLDLSARDGAMAQRAAEFGARRFTLYERDPDLALLAATRIRFIRACEVSVFIHDPLFLGSIRESRAQPMPEAIHDCVVAIPPLGIRVPEAVGRMAYVRTRRAELLHLQRVVTALKPGGRAAVLMPNSFLFSDGDYLRVRQWLLRNIRVEAVVELPPHAFSSVGEVKGAVLLIRRQPPGEDVWFVRPNQFMEANDRPIAGDPNGVDHEILHTAIAARWNLGNSDELRAKILKLEAAPSNEKCERAAPEGGVGLTENNRRLLTLARHFLGEDAAGARFPELVPVAEILLRKAELLWKENRSISLDALLAEFVAARKSVRIVRLADIAEVIGGTMHPAIAVVDTATVPDETLGDRIGLLRVSDFPKSLPGEHSAPSLRKVRRHLKSVSPKDQPSCLRSDDVLLSIDGTIGRVCVFDEEHVHRSFAAKGIAIVRPPDRLMSAFLSKLFTSEPYQRWFAGEATGNTIQHLQLARLRNLPVPMLPRHEMHAITDELETRASEARIRAIFNFKRDFSELASRLLDNRDVSVFTGLSSDELERATVVDVLKSACEEIAVWERLAARENAAVRYRLEVLQRLATGLLEALVLPETSDRFAVLQEWRISAAECDREFRRVRNDLTHAPVGSDETHLVETMLVQRTEGFIASLLRLAQLAIQRQLRDVRLTATIAPAVVTVGEQAELTVTVRNEGTLALKRVTLTFPDERFRAPQSWPLLSGKGTNQWPFPWLPEQAGKKLFRIDWHAFRLDEQKVSGVFELAVEVKSLGSVALCTDLGDNPYVYLRVLAEEEDDRMFFGRRRALDELVAAISQRGTTTIKLIEGNRRVGKTSLLRHFVRHRLPKDWVPVFFSFQDCEGDSTGSGKAGIPTEAIWAGLARELISAAAIAVPNLELPTLGAVPPQDSSKFDSYILSVGTLIDSATPFACFKMLLNIARAAIKPRRLLLLLDEFDSVQAGIDSGITSKQVPENIRQIFQKHGDVAGMLTGSRTIRRLRQEYWSPLFGMGDPLTLGALEEDEARQLIEQPVAGRLVYSEEALRVINTLTARRPELIQGLCRAIFDGLKDTAERSVTAAVVENTADEFVLNNEHFATLWGYAKSERKRLLILLAGAMQDTGNPASFDGLLAATEEAGVAFSRMQLEAAVQDLLDLEILHAESSNALQHYTLEVPLFARWMRREQDMERTRSAAREED